jgi:MFS family permease
MLVKTATGFYILRFLLGSFEAGLLPGVVLYLTYWFPARRRALMLGLFLISVLITAFSAIHSRVELWGRWGSGWASPTGSGSSSWKVFRPLSWDSWH